MSIETQELAARYGAAWAEHDLDAIMAMHTDDTVFHLHEGQRACHGKPLTTPGSPRTARSRSRQPALRAAQP
jgi:ketosteroid isomerase-like protein